MRQSDIIRQLLNHFQPIIDSPTPGVDALHFFENHPDYQYVSISTSSNVKTPYVCAPPDKSWQVNVHHHGGYVTDGHRVTVHYYRKTPVYHEPQPILPCQEHGR